MTDRREAPIYSAEPRHSFCCTEEDTFPPGKWSWTCMRGGADTGGWHVLCWHCSCSSSHLTSTPLKHLQGTGRKRKRLKRTVTSPRGGKVKDRWQNVDARFHPEKLEQKQKELWLSQKHEHVNQCTCSLKYWLFCLSAKTNYQTFGTLYLWKECKHVLVCKVNISFFLINEGGKGVLVVNRYFWTTLDWKM